mgnify:CR=1 FL=1
MKKVLLLTTLLCGTLGFSQISSPPSGGNQKSAVTQYMGLVSVTITYNSPDVTGPGGQDRAGKIWGQLVPYGLTNLQFGQSTDENPSPWRAGANENTTIQFSHDVSIEGKPLKAGTYGLHMIPGETEWTVIFSNNSSSWGSYFYNPEEDALRVKVTPAANEYNEYLTYEFDERKQDQCLVSMEWENLKVPFKISVPNLNELYVQQIEEELRGSAGFNYQNLVTAANFAVSNNVALDKAEQWANAAVSAPFVGQENYTTLSTQATVLLALGKTDEAKAAMKKAIFHPTANVFQIHQTGRALIAQDKDDFALQVFKWNAERFPKTWPINVGLARGYSANGDYSKALKHAEMALKVAPDKLNQDSLQAAIEKLKNKEDIN